MTDESNSKKEKKENSKDKNELDELTKEYLDSDKEFEDLFPNLAKEMEIGELKVPIAGIRSNKKEVQDMDELSELKNPDVISFIRRCSCNEEAIEIIEN